MISGRAESAASGVVSASFGVFSCGGGQCAGDCPEGACDRLLSRTSPFFRARLPDCVLVSFSDVLSPSKRRQTIVDAADYLFNAHGILVTDLAAVAERSGVTVADIGGEFSGKDDLVETVLDARHHTWVGHVHDACDQVEDPRGKILSIFTFLEGWFAEDTFRGCAFVNSYAELGRQQAWVADMAGRHVATFTLYVEDLAVAAGLPRPLGASIALLAEGAQVTAALTGTVTPAREARMAAAMLIAVYDTDQDIPDF